MPDRESHFSTNGPPAEGPEAPDRLDRIEAMLARRQRATVVLEDILDPHNVGAVLRSCDAFGVQHVILLSQQRKPYELPPTTAESSASAIAWLTVEHATGSAQCLDDLRSQGHTIFAAATPQAPTYATDPQAPVVGSSTLTQATFTCEKPVLLFGSEGVGLTDTALARAHQRVHVPMRGVVESLNLSVTAALFLHEMTRQRDQAGMDQFLLAEDERKDLAQKLIAQRLYQRRTMRQLQRAKRRARKEADT